MLLNWKGKGIMVWKRQYSHTHPRARSFWLAVKFPNKKTPFTVLLKSSYCSLVLNSGLQNCNHNFLLLPREIKKKKNTAAISNSQNVHQHFHCCLLHVSKSLLTLINFHHSPWLLNSSKVKQYTFLI